MATLLFGTPFVERKALKYKDAIQELYVKRRDLLKAHGLDVKFLSSDNFILNSGANIGRVLEEVMPESVLRISRNNMPKESYVQLVQWPRDAFQIFGGTAYVPEKYSSVIPKIVEKIRPGLEYVVSDVGEQGLSIRVNNILLGAALKILDWSILEKHDIKAIPFLCVECVGSIKRKILYPNMRPNGHLDPHINGIAHDNYKALFVTRNYNLLFHKYIHKVAKKFGMEKEIIYRRGDLECCAINFAQLPDGSVIIPEKAHQTIDKLARYLPQDKILALPTIPIECGKYHGLRCETNIIP